MDLHPRTLHVLEVMARDIDGRDGRLCHGQLGNLVPGTTITAIGLMISARRCEERCKIFLSVGSARDKDTFWEGAAIEVPEETIGVAEIVPDPDSVLLQLFP